MKKILLLTLIIIGLFLFNYKKEDVSLVFNENEYNNNYDSYNGNLPSAEDQANDKSSMLSFYRAIAAIKQDPSFPINGEFVAYPYTDNSDVYHYVIKSNSDTTKDYKIFIHTGGNNGASGPVLLSAAENDELVYKYNYNSEQGALYAYGVYVTRSK